jgi:hypothetical protein
MDILSENGRGRTLFLPADRLNRERPDFGVMDFAAEL